LQLLDAGVIDLLLQRSTELLPILGLAPDSLAVGRWTFTPSYALLPLNTESVQIYAQRDHPLHGVAAVTPAQLRTFPSPAFADSIFPGLKDCLRPHGLWGTRLRSTAMRHCFWEFFALELGMIVASTPNAVSVATQHDPGVLRPVSYSTGLVDHDLLVVPIDLLDEPSVDSVISSITATYNLKLPKGRRLGGVSHRLLRAPHTAVSW
jgi:hypothetical protein